MSLDLKGLRFVFHSKSVSEEDDRRPFEDVVTGSFILLSQ